MGPKPAGLTAEEKHAWDQLVDFYSNGLGYAQEMAGRPQTLYALADSPVGLAAWIIDHDIRSYDLIARVFDGAKEGLTQGRYRRQHHALLADQHGRLLGAAVPGKQARLLRAEGRPAADRRQRLP